MSRYSIRFAFARVGNLIGLLIVLFLFCGDSYAQQAQITPSQASPGQTVFIQLKIRGFKEVGRIGVRLEGPGGERTARVVGIVDERTIQVMVPKMAPGGVKVSVSYDGNTVAQGTMSIVTPLMRRIFLQMEGDSVIVKRVRPYNGEFDPIAKSGRRLSYDVWDADSVLLYSGAIPHPAVQSSEVFGPRAGESPARVPVTEPASFVIKVPYAPGGLTVRLYDVGVDIDLSTPKGRAQRRSIAVIEVPKGQ